MYVIFVVANPEESVVAKGVMLARFPGVSTPSPLVSSSKSSVPLLLRSSLVHPPATLYCGCQVRLPSGNVCWPLK